MNSLPTPLCPTLQVRRFVSLCRVQVFHVQTIQPGARTMITQLLILLLSVVMAQHGSAQQNLFPAAIPLAVRSPYLSCFQPTTNWTTIGTLWPTTSAHQ